MARAELGGGRRRRRSSGEAAVRGNPRDTSGRMGVDRSDGEVKLTGGGEETRWRRLSGKETRRRWGIG